MTLEGFRLTEHLNFKPEQGQINLGGSRVMLMNESAMASLLEILSVQVGDLMSRMILARFGYQNAVKDYQSLQELFPNLTDTERLAMGPLMHAWSGIVSVKPELMDVDRASGRFHFKGRWYNSYEAHAYLKRYGLSAKPVCFSLTGYGSGWCSSYFDQELLEIETKCVACGDDYCEWEIKPVGEWGPEAEPWKQALAGTSRSVQAELEETARQLRQVNEGMELALETRARSQREQLRMICHDVEGPLRLAVHALTMDQSGANQTAVSQAIKQLRRIDDMVSRARGVSRMIDGKITPEREPVNLAGVVEDLVGDLKLQISHKQLLMNIDVDTSMGGLADRHILRDQVLANLLSNAIKFSSRGGVISILGVRDAAGRVGIKICDQGIGIPKSMVANIFDPRSRNSRQGTDGEDGTGYGLALAKSGVEAMGGQVELMSTTVADDPFHHGTAVTVWIPDLSF